MKTVVVKIDGKSIRSETSFHKVFAKEFGFPDFYGKNLNAWRDCMKSLDSDDEMSKVKVRRGGLVLLHVENADTFRRRCPELFYSFQELCASINEERRERGVPPVLALAFYTD